ncbi:putative thrombospondin type 1 domain-containing protein [Neospora caninum Liverpool]|uniref:Putative thrombospondin type 1 domain-containing protein n=1 Tax=Neospora caninum (strain Liverpool) TaxID=572307 RepID=F0VK69_NEOCL|nr:putative thrombospondin type 1 domain-containing protein [Neospora caninum Liverpool]CBZ54470.1 putative thrombospondin type 1 domain-containing protein [Neospora caninum Liverpool]|eukprot:XP_003884500.1 putative thrombospondin type 1 domain-containing protein [Neospora caninum Liverpool]
MLFLLCLLLPLSLHNSDELPPFSLKVASARNASEESPQEDVSLMSACSLVGTFTGDNTSSSCLLAYSFDAPDLFHLLRTTPREPFFPLQSNDAPGGAAAPVLVAVSARRRLSLKEETPSPPQPHSNETFAKPFLDKSNGTDFRENAPWASLREEETDVSRPPSARLLSDAEIFDFAVRRLQGFGSLFGGPGPGSSADRGAKKRPGFGVDLGDGEDSLSGSSLGSGGGTGGSRKVLMSNGLVCEDDARVEEFGAKCKLIARSLGGRLGCEKKLSEIAPDGQLPPTIPAFSRVADACPLTCGLCEECAPGCALWFLGNTLCDEACNNALCQFDGGDCWSADCVVSDWAEWSNCSVSCGGPGTEKRSREIKSKPKQGGSPCPKLEEIREGCNANVKCPENCVVSDWGEWSDCSTTCGEGQSRRQREILKHPDTDGQKCPETEQARVCMKDSCTTSCVVSEWSEWGPCGASCGGGERTRKRSIISPPVNGGAICPSLTEDEVKQLNMAADKGGCKGTYTSVMTSPATAAASNRLRRFRVGTVERMQRDMRRGTRKPNQRNNGRASSLLLGSVVGLTFSPAQSTVSVFCLRVSSPSREKVGVVEPITTRSRAILLEAPDCPSPSTLIQSEACTALGFQCDVDCEVGEWGAWGPCSATCGGGQRRRRRAMLRSPKGQGKACPPLVDVNPCALESCAVVEGQMIASCVYGEWSPFRECDATCGVGRQRSIRAILAFPSSPFDPEGNIMLDSTVCTDTDRFQTCHGPPCPVDCQVTAWGAWSSCSVTCGGGNQDRLRSVVRPAANGGKECPILRQVHTCATYPCPTDCLLSDWTEWTLCSAECGLGAQTRTRRILTPASVDPPGAACGPLAEEKKCFSTRGACKEDCELSEWSPWTPCSQSCGVGGVRTSSREIRKPGGVGGGRSCAGESLLKEEACNENIPCVGDCEVGDWGDWTGCSVSCSEWKTQEEKMKSERGARRMRSQRPPQATGAREGRRLAPAFEDEAEEETGRNALASLPGGGKRMRSRAILKPEKNGGKACPPTEEIDDSCNADIPCPVECTYTPWTDWTPCSVTCGVGRQTRTREIETEARFGGQPCDNLEDAIDCMADVLCVDDCEVSEWGDWSSCSATCGGGVRKRGRQVMKPPSNGGRPCPPLTDFDACGLASCHGTDCEVAEWGAWSACSKNCGGGVHVRTRAVLTEKRGNGRDCPSPLFEREGCNLFRCPDTVCEDNPDVPVMTGGVECRVLLAMGCHRLLKDLAEENDREFPSHIPPETRVQDACPTTCGTCTECAPGCQLRDLGNRHCDEACNNPACRMDLGDCGGDCELDREKRSNFFAALGVAAEPPTSTLLQGQMAVLSCKDAGTRFAGFPALRQLAIACRGRDAMEVLPHGLRLGPDSEGSALGGDRPQRDLALPACVPDVCPYVHVEGFADEGGGKPRGPSLKQLNGIYYRGDAQRGLPRYIQDKYSKPKYFLWMHADADAAAGADAPQDAFAAQAPAPGSAFVWRLTATDPLDSADSSFTPSSRETEKGEKEASGSLSAAGVGARCTAPPVGQDGPLDCVDVWAVGEVNAAGAVQAEKKIPAKTITLRCLASEEEKDEVEAALRAASLSSAALASERPEAFRGPPSTVVAGTPMICEDQPDVERVSQKTCAELKKLLKCDFVLEDAGVEDLPDFLPADATLALACPQTCGLCKECAFRCPLWFLGNRHCDAACNNAECEFDRGDCAGENALAGAGHGNREAGTRGDGDAQGAGGEAPSSGLSVSEEASQKKPPRSREREGYPAAREACADDPAVKEMGYTCKLLIKVAKEQFPALGCEARLLDLNKDAHLPPGIPKITRVKDACPKSCDACDDEDLLRRPSPAGAAPSAAEDKAVPCEDDPAVREMGYTCKLLLSVAQEGKGGCNARLLDLDENKQELPPGIPTVTRVKDACPKTCNACNDPDRLIRRNEDAATACEDDPLVKSMGYTCKLLVRAAEEHEGCATRLITLKPDQVLPPGIPNETRVKDACPKTCRACTDPDRLVRPAGDDPATACEDNPAVEALGYTCKLLLSVAATEDLGGCSALLRDLQRPGEKMPSGLPEETRVKDACPKTCRSCDDPSLLVPAAKEKPDNLSCLGDCCDVPMLEQETGYTCKQIKAFVNDDCSILLKDLSSAPLPPQVPASTTLEDACPFTCGACSTEQCNDNPLVEFMGYSCAAIIEAAASRGGCDAFLKDLAAPADRPFPPEIPAHTRVKDACMRSCKNCPSIRETDQAAPCHDDPRLPQMGYSCETMLPYASRGCGTVLRDLLPSTTVYLDGVDPAESLATYCSLSCGICMQKKQKPGNGCRNNPLVEAHGFSCALLVKASALGCNAKLKDLSDAPLPLGIPPNTRVKDACLLECGGCIEVPTCYDGFQNGEEEGVDCGGPCRPCHSCSPSLFKTLGDAYAITDGRGTQHGAFREIRCADGFDKVGGKEPETLVCQDGVFPNPTLKCDIRKVEVEYGTLTIDNAGDLGPEAIPSLYFALLHALRLTTPYELRLLAAGTERRSREALMGGAEECTDDPRVEQMGYSCDILASFCNAELHALAQSQGKQLPAWLPQGARVKDACPATCGACGRRRRLSALASVPSSSRSLSSSSSVRPLLLDYGVAWSTPNLPFSSRFTDETPALFLNSLYSQFLDRNLALIDRRDGTLQSAAVAMRQRPFLVTFEAPSAMRLSLRFWDKGFGAFSPPEVARGLFAVAGLPLPTAQEISFGLQPGARGPGGGEAAKISPHAEVQYTLTNERKTLVPLQPGLGQLVGACASLEAQKDPNSCCGFHAEMQARNQTQMHETGTIHNRTSMQNDSHTCAFPCACTLLDGPCGVQLYTQRLSADSVQAFCSGRVGDRRCLSSFLLLLDFYRRRPGVGCGYLAFAERVVDAWCARDDAGNFCFSEVEKTLESLEGPGYLAAKTSDELDKACHASSCYMKNIRYLDAITQLQVAWKLLGGLALPPKVEAGFAPSERRRAAEHSPDELADGGTTQPSRQTDGDSSSLRRLQKPGGDGESAERTANGLERRAAKTKEEEEETDIGENGEEADLGGIGEESENEVEKGQVSSFSLRSSVSRRLASRPLFSAFASSRSPHTFSLSASTDSPGSSGLSSREWVEALDAHATRRDRAYHALARRLQQSVAATANILGIPLDGSTFLPSHFSPSSKSPFSADSPPLETRAALPGKPTDAPSSPDSPRLLPFSSPRLLPFSSPRFSPSSPRFSPSSPSASASGSSSSSFSAGAPRRLKGLEPRMAARFDGPLGESLEEMVTLMCTKVEGDYCQQTLVLLAEESPVKNPTLVIQPCSSRCFVPITGLLGSLVESYGERYADPFHSALGKIMRAYGRFYCTYAESGQVCGEILFNKLKHVDVPSFTPQGLEVNFSQCTCPQSFVQDGQCDRSCFNEACGWDGQDCLVRRMFPEIYEALLSLVSPQCSVFSAAFECTPRCKKQYEHLLLSQDKNCCMAAGFELLASLLAVDVTHPLFEGEAWEPARSLAYLEHLCDFSLDRTCSLGRPRQQVVISTTLLGVKAGLLLADAAKLREVEAIIRKTAAQKFALVDQDVARSVARPAPGGVEILSFIDAGVYTDRTLLAVTNQTTLAQMDDAVLRRLGAVALEPYRDFEHIGPLSVQTSSVPLTRATTTPAVSSSSPALPFAGTWGVHELPVDLPKEGCSVADLHRLLHPGYSLILGSVSSFPLPPAPGRTAGQGDRLLGESTETARGRESPESHGGSPKSPEPRPYPAAGALTANARRRLLTTPGITRRLAATSRLSPASSPSSFSLASFSPSLTARRLQESALGRFSPSDEPAGPTGLSSGGQRAWYSHGEGETVKCAEPLYSSVAGPAVDRVVCDNGSWTFENLLVCKRSCPPAAQYFASQAASSFSSQMSPYRVAGDSISHGSVVSVSCAEGFSPADLQVSPSRFECVDSQWVGRSLVCSPLCPPFPDLGEAYLVRGEGHEHGDTRVVTCTRGFYPQHRSFTSICEASRWSPPLFECTQATPPDMQEGATGLQKILLQMFSSEGVLGLVIFSVLVTLAAVAVFIAWRLHYKTRARQNFIAREETVQALKVSSLPAGIGAGDGDTRGGDSGGADPHAANRPEDTLGGARHVREDTGDAEHRKLSDGLGGTRASRSASSCPSYLGESSLISAQQSDPNKSSIPGYVARQLLYRERENEQDEDSQDGQVSLGSVCVTAELQAYTQSRQAPGPFPSSAVSAEPPLLLDKNDVRQEESRSGRPSSASLLSSRASSETAPRRLVSSGNPGMPAQANSVGSSGALSAGSRDSSGLPSFAAFRPNATLSGDVEDTQEDGRREGKHSAFAGLRKHQHESNEALTVPLPPHGEGAAYVASVSAASLTETSTPAPAEASVRSLHLFHKLHAEHMQRQVGGRGREEGPYTRLREPRERQAGEAPRGLSQANRVFPSLIVSREEPGRRERDEEAAGHREGRRVQDEIQFAAPFSACDTISEGNETVGRSTPSDEAGPNQAESSPSLSPVPSCRQAELDTEACGGEEPRPTSGEGDPPTRTSE